MDEILNNGESKVYLKFYYNDDKTKPLPYVRFIFGIEKNFPTWIGEPATFKAEDGFVMDGTTYQEFLNTLDNLIKNYKEKTLEIFDYLADTDSNIIIDCQADRVVIKAQLGSTFDRDMPVVNFEITTDSTFLRCLYETLMNNTEF